MRTIHRALLLLSAVVVLNSCGGGGKISVLPVQDAFDDKDMNFNPKMDILWVVDPSRSMREEIQKVRANIGEFVQEFITSEYQYRMGVITTAAWSDDVYLGDEAANPDLWNASEGPAFRSVFARLHRGECVDDSYATKRPILDYLTASDIGFFMKRFNTIFDVYGTQLSTFQCGLDHINNYASVAGNVFEGLTVTQRRNFGEQYILEEKPLQSMRAFLRRDQALDISDENKFIRDDAYLAVIIITDEPDSSDGAAEDYINYLKSIKNNPDDADSLRNFGVYTIVKTDIPNHFSAQAAHLASGNSTPMTNCLASSNCFNIDDNDYTDNLNRIKNAILVEATAYPLSREPNVNSVRITINKEDGSSVELSKDDLGTLWFYDETTQAITFHESILPTPKDIIDVGYTPRNLGTSDPIKAFIDLIGNSVLENQADTLVGTATFVNGAQYNGDHTYAITGANPGGFVIDPSTGEIRTSTALDADIQSRYEVTVALTVTEKLPELGEGEEPPVVPPTPSVLGTFSRVFMIRVLDVPDLAPVAQNIVMEVSVTAANAEDDIIVTRNVAYEAEGLDSSEAHIFKIPTQPAKGEATIDEANGIITFKIHTDHITIGAGTNEEITFSYTITGTEGEDVGPTSATFTVSIIRENNPPELIKYLGCPDESVNCSPGIPIVEVASGSGAEEEVLFNATDVTASCIASGSAADLVNTNPSQGLRTCDGRSGSYIGAPYIELNFPVTKPFFEVQEFRVQGRHGLGNAVMQVIAEDGRVLEREILGVTAGASEISRTMQRPVIGKKIRILRPQGSTNPLGHQYLDVGKFTAFGTEAVVNNIQLDDYFFDPDFAAGDTLTYALTGPGGEGAPPPWASIAAGNVLRLMPPLDTDRILRVEATDSIGEMVFWEFRVTRTGSGEFSNAAPISLLALDDSLRGGVSMMRFGGVNASNNIVHIEIDNFLAKPYRNFGAGNYVLASDPDQTPHLGDVRSGETENGWSQTPVHTDDKYPLSSMSYCSGTTFGGNYGKIIPCINSARSYGEIYSGYFVPASTGVYKFRTRIVDNTVMLRMAPTEYLEDAMNLMIANWKDDKMESSLVSVAGINLGSAAAQASEFAGSGGASSSSFTNYSAVGYDTELFFQMDGISDSYEDGYVHLRQGNLYAFEIRFGEGGGSVFFDFEYSRKNSTCDPDNEDMDNEGMDGGVCWSTWAPLDASVVVPDRGINSYTPRVIGGLGGVNFDVSQLFYDPEGDILEYSARLVDANGSIYSTDLSTIGLALSTSGVLTGTLNSTFDSDRPRIVFTATETEPTLGKSGDSLPIKFDETVAP